MAAAAALVTTSTQAEVKSPTSALSQIQSQNTSLSLGEMGEVRGEAIPWPLYYAVLHAPSLAALLSSAIRF